MTDEEIDQEFDMLDIYMYYYIIMIKLNAEIMIDYTSNYKIPHGILSFKEFKVARLNSAIRDNDTYLNYYGSRKLHNLILNGRIMDKHIKDIVTSMDPKTPVFTTAMAGILYYEQIHGKGSAARLIEQAFNTPISKKAEDYLLNITKDII